MASSELAQSLEGSGIRFVRVVWCDSGNVIRGKAVSTRKLQGDYFKHGVGIAAAQMAVPVQADFVAPESGLSPVGEVRLMPDWATLTTLPYAPGQARVLGDMVKNGQPWTHCPRHFLKKQIAEADKAGFDLMASFENEFYLFKPNGPNWEPVDHTNFASTLAMDASRPVIDEIADHLLAQKIPVEQYYPESGTGQHEMTVRYTNALAAADRQIVFRDTVRATALRHGLRASFLPKVFADQAGSGCHLHLSLWKGGQNLTPGGGDNLSPKARSFLAGILHHMPALMAFTTPTNNSFRRIKPRSWAGAFRCWGIDNREAAVRVPSNPDGGGPTHIEFKTLDASANPYLALGAVLAAGLDGVKQNLTPPEPVNVDPADLSDDEKRKRGIVPLPGNLSGALHTFSSDLVLIGALGQEFAQSYLAVRHAEMQHFKGMDLADEVKLLLERY